MTKASYTIPALIIVFGGGLAYWVMSNRDTTPVGLTIVKNIEDAGEIGEDEDGNIYNLKIMTGTWRASDSTLPVISEDEDKPLLIVFKNGEPVKGEIVDINEWLPSEGDDAGEFMLNVLENQLALQKEFDIETTETQNQIDAMKNTAEAESIFGPVMSLQSNFVW